MFVTAEVGYFYSDTYGLHAPLCSGFRPAHWGVGHARPNGLVESLSIIELCTQMGVLDLASDT